MIKVSTRELSGASLDYAVAICKGEEVLDVDRWLRSRNLFAPWLYQCLPLWHLFAEVERFSVIYRKLSEDWEAVGGPYSVIASKPGLAVLRLYCLQKAGEEVEVPPALVGLK